MTKFIKKSEINSRWYEIDAKNAVVGRLATIITKIIRGKNSPKFSPHMDHGDFVVVKNIEHIKYPRGALAEFGTTIADDKEIRVWDSTSEMRYLVIPERPAGTEGWSEDQLRALVTRNSMIGVEEAKSPETVL